MAATFESLMYLDAKLAARAEYPLPDFWRDVGRRLYEHPTANLLVARCGRGSVKSGFGSRVALNEVLLGDFEVPLGEVHYWVDVSENKAEALQRTRQYETWLKLLGIDHERRGDEIVLPELRRGFLARAFQVGRVSGFRGLGWRADELAKCSADAEAADPAVEVVSSLAAMTVTQLRHRPKGLMLASPLGFVDHHAQRFAMGETADQILAYGPTWLCNSSITEADTRRLAPDQRIWRREYLAEPQAGLLAAFSPELVLAAFEPRTEAA